MRNLPCGCSTDGRLCDDHRPRRWGDALATDPAAIVGLALFIGVIAVWAAILS